MHQNKHTILSIITISLVLLLSCTTYTLKTPPNGKTGSFFERNSDQLKINSRYDFSRLQRNYGLVIFSYEIEGMTGSNLGGSNPEVKTGIRVWEEKFDDKDWEIKQVEKKIELWKKSTFVGASMSETTTSVKLGVTFHKGRIVYGGRMVASDIGDDFEVLMEFEVDCEMFLKTYENQLDGINIDTALVKFISKY